MKNINTLVLLIISLCIPYAPKIRDTTAGAVGLNLV